MFIFYDLVDPGVTTDGAGDETLIKLDMAYIDSKRDA